MNIPSDLQVDEMVALTVMGYTKLPNTPDPEVDPTKTYVYRDLTWLMRSTVPSDNAWYDWAPFSPCRNLEHALEVKRKALELGLSVMVRSTKAMGVMVVVSLKGWNVGTYSCDVPENEARAICMAILRALDELGKQANAKSSVS